MKLPWRSEVLESMLAYDLIGFQTQRDVKNFNACLETLTGSPGIKGASFWSVKSSHGETHFGHFPISIDFQEFEDLTQSQEISAMAEKIRSDMNVEHLVLSLDRLDYTKGISFRMRAFAKLFELEPDLRRKVAVLQVVVPSRVEVPEYQALQAEIEQLVSQLNGSIGEPGWMPVHHLFRSLTREEVLAMYRASDVALVTPLKDGMNLVAKEYCASRVNDDGALVLSEFAGAAEELQHDAILVNPCDVDGVAHALLEAFRLSNSSDQTRMRSLRAQIRSADVYRWADSFLEAAGWDWSKQEVVEKPARMWERLRRIMNVFDM